MTEVFLPHDWSPRAYQRALWGHLERGGKRAVAVWHRRAGKDSICLNWTAVAAHERVANYWHMLPQYNQARKAIWDAVNPHTGQRLIDQAFPEALRDTTRDHEMMIRFKNGSTWQVVGSDNYDALVGTPPAGVVFSEYALADPTAWDYLRPILAENGGWALFIYTPRGKNHGYNLFSLAQTSPGWFAELLTAEETGAVNPDILKTELSEYIKLHGAEAGQAYYDQEYRCSFNAPILGAYYGPQMQQALKDGRITNLPHHPAAAVHTAWDLGIGDATSIWFAQFNGPWLDLIDYYEASGYGVEHYVKALQSKPYVYGNHWAPHDAQAREWGSGKTRIETAGSLGLKFRLVPNIGVDDGINAVRQTLPVCRFDAERCQKGIDALTSYHKEWDDKRMTFLDKPYHDWASHGADAFRMLSLAWREEAGILKRPIEGLSGVTLDRLWQDRRRGANRRV